MARHLKEIDGLISFIRSMITHTGWTADGKRLSVVQAFETAEVLLREHHQQPADSRLRSLLPKLSEVFVPLPLSAALREFDQATGMTKRAFVPPTFAEVRKVLNLAVVAACKTSLRLLTLDADDTIYSDGMTLTAESPVIPLIVRLLRLGVHVSLVTAAAYPGEPHKMEVRIAGLLRSFAFAVEAGASPAFLSFFHVMGGECNYLLEPALESDADGLSSRVSLREVPDEEWKGGRGVRWDHAEVRLLLDTAEDCLLKTAERLGLSIMVVRKDRAVGIIANPHAVIAGAPAGYRARLSYEVLEEVALTVQQRLRRTPGLAIPFCSFNGGRDVFIDVGHKALGIRALQARIGAQPNQTVHAGDRFTATGNDLRTRDVANTLWVDGPPETEYLLTRLIQGIREHRRGGGGEAVAAEAAAAGAASGSSTAEAAAADGPRCWIDGKRLVEAAAAVLRAAHSGASNTAAAVSTAHHTVGPDFGYMFSPTSASPSASESSTSSPSSPPLDATEDVGGGIGVPSLRVTGGDAVVLTPSWLPAAGQGGGMGGMLVEPMTEADALELGEAATPATVPGSNATGTASAALFAAAHPGLFRLASSTAPSSADASSVSIPSSHSAPQLLQLQQQQALLNSSNADDRSFHSPLASPTSPSAGASVFGGLASTATGGGVSGGSSHTVPGVYGLTLERAHLQADDMARDAMRSQWSSAGGRVTALVGRHYHTHSPQHRQQQVLHRSKSHESVATRTSGAADDLARSDSAAASADCGSPK